MKKSPHKRAPLFWFSHLHAVVTSLQKVFRKGAPLCGDMCSILLEMLPPYETRKPPHKRAPSSWFWHLHAVVTSLQKVFREGAPLCGGTDCIIPVGSKGAALRLGLQCALASLSVVPPGTTSTYFRRSPCSLHQLLPFKLVLSEPSSKHYVIRVMGSKSGTGVTHRPKKQVFGILKLAGNGYD